MSIRRPRRVTTKCHPPPLPLSSVQLKARKSSYWPSTGQGPRLTPAQSCVLHSWRLGAGGCGFPAAVHETSKCRTQMTFGFNVCVDRIVAAQAVLPALQLRGKALRAQDHSVVADDAALAEVFLHHMAAGAAGERIVTDSGLWARLLAAAGSDAAGARDHVGGNAALMAMQAAHLCPSCDILLGGVVGPSLAAHLPDRLLLLGDADTDEVHLILEYPAGWEWQGAVAPRANRFILTADATNGQSDVALQAYSHLRGTAHADLRSVQEAAVGDGLPSMLRLEQAMRAAEMQLEEAAAQGKSVPGPVRGSDATGSMTVTLAPDGTLLDGPMQHLPFHDADTSGPLPPHYFATLNVLDPVDDRDFERVSLFRSALNMHGHVTPDQHYAHGHVRDGDGLPTPTNVLVIAGLHMYEGSPASSWDFLLQDAFTGVHTLPGFPLVHVELASMALPAFILKVARQAGRHAHSLGLNEQELADLYEALGGAYIDDIADMPTIQAFVQERQEAVRQALLAAKPDLPADVQCETPGAEAGPGQVQVSCSDTAALHAYVKSEGFSDTAKHPYTVDPVELTNALVRDALGRGGAGVAHVQARTDLTRVVPDPRAVAAALRFVLAHSPAVCRVHFHSLAFHIMAQRKCLVPPDLRTWTLGQPAPAAAAGVQAVTLKACSVTSVNDLSPGDTELLAPLSFHAGDPVLAAVGQREEAPDVEVQASSGVAQWSWSDLRRFHFGEEVMYTDEHTPFRPVKFAYVPVAVCKQPKATVGLGDAISATGLLAHVRPWGPGQAFPRPTIHSVGHPGSSGGKMGVAAPTPPPAESSTTEPDPAGDAPQEAA